MKDTEIQFQVIRREVEDAADALIAAASQGLELVEKARAGDASAFDALEETFCGILTTCAFQDLTDQRMSRLVKALFGPADALPADPLLAGPANPGQGLDQSRADKLFTDGG